MTNLQAKKKLIKVRKLIENGWCKGCSARTKDNFVIDSKDKNAVKFCLIGACSRVTKYEEFFSLLEYFYKVQKRVKSLPAFNDDPQTTHKMVLNLIDRAIKNC